MVDAKLLVVGGGTGEKEIPLSLPATVGRGPDNSISLVQPLVSRVHCEIYAIDDELWVRDLNSLNGTYVGCDRIEGEHRLRPGELLTIGTVTFRALYGGALETDAYGFLRDPESALDAETMQIASESTLLQSLEEIAIALPEPLLAAPPAVRATRSPTKSARKSTAARPR